ncbi:MAG: hypothetical protein KatS3mg052_2618 [Candidatus Roseilinea sp.]|nr:MAG: hypothetical protein KatS3mg052_2618 [Candidatus Roseilinea sp.]
MSTNGRLLNYINGQWMESGAGTFLDVKNPATAQVMAQVPLSPAEEVHLAAEAGVKAFKHWRRVPAVERVQHLYKFKRLLEEHRDELSRLITNECGKTYAESQAEMQRAIENVEVACGIPSLMQGFNNEDIARGIDEHCFRQPLGVVAAITPFNFPGMVPLWFLPYAVATGNCFILKPSEKVPMTMQRIFQLLEQSGFPPGVVQVVNGAKEAVDAILDHPDIRAVSFVGSTPVARYIYERAARAGKRVQAQGGAKNPVVIMPDADMDMTTRIVADSAFGCAGQRCLAASVGITVGEARNIFVEQLADAAASRKVGYGLDEGVEMGPVITAESKARIEKLIALGEQEGAQVLVDGRNKKVKGYEDGNFVFPHHPGPRAAQERDRPHRNLRPGVQPDACRDHRGSDRAGQRPQLRQHGMHLHQQRRGGASVPLRGEHRQRRHQRRRGRADGLLPLQRLARELLRRPARSGHARRRVLHRDQGRRRTLAERVEPEVLVRMADPLPQLRMGFTRASTGWPHRNRPWATVRAHFAPNHSRRGIAPDRAARC